MAKKPTVTKKDLNPVDIMAVLAKDGKSIQEDTLAYLQMEPASKLKDMMMDYPLRGGKHLRSVLALESCKAFGGNPDDMKKISVALEVFQHWILIHDDIEDYSEERRGKPALHQIHGMPLANNVGDALHVKMWQLLLENRELVGDEVAFKIMNEIANMTLRCTRGQSMDLEWVHEKRWDISEEDYYTMCKGKTCGYTFISPFRLGAIISKVDEKKLEPFNQIGDDIGLAFQIEDDVLNLIGEEGKYGKEIAGDLYEGKRTLMLIHLMKSCTPDEKKKVLSIMNKEREDKKQDEIEVILSLMKKYGSIGYAKEKALFFAKKARKDFDREYSFIKDSDAKKFIEGLFDFVINRDM